MSGEEFMEVYNDAELRDYVKSIVCQAVHKPELREDLYQEAWLVISMAPGDYSTEAYKRLVRPAILSAYRQEYKEWHLYRHFGAVSAEINVSHEHNHHSNVQELQDAGITIRTRKEWRKAKKRGK